MDKSEPMTELEKEQALIKSVFSTPDGQKLLSKLADQYVWSKQLHPDPYVLYSRIGQQELVTHFMVSTAGVKK
ncbi:MAG: hypothetical protein KAH64_02460 [Nitrosomonadaceae bacterium]|nr:hypothetical protein [Nitrosomonadaceae bacterium]